MKKFIALGIAMIMILSTTWGAVSTVFAAKSINDDTRDVVVVDEEPLPSGEEVIIDDLDYSKIDNDDVKDVVEKINTGEKVTPADTADLIEQQKPGKQDPEHFPTNEGVDANLELYDYITPYNNIEIDGTDQDVRIRVPATIGLKETDVLVMYIDPVTGEISLLFPTDFDPETGEMTVKFPGSGIFALMQKIPIVVRNVHPDEYPNEDVAAAIRSLPEDEFLELRDWLKAFNIEGDTLEIADGKTVNIDDYDSANYMADLAVQFSLIQYGYNLNTKVNAKLYQQLDDINYERVLDYAGIDYDADAVKEDRTKLKEIEPFVLEDCFVFHVDATTGETSIAYEPEITFRETKDLSDYEIKIMNEDVHDESVDILDGDKDEAADEKTSDNGLIWKAYAAENKLTERQKELVTWNVKDIDNDDEDQMNIVMNHDEYLGMGPFLLLMPKNKTAAADFPWWVLGLVGAGGVAGVVAKKKHDENKEIAE